MHLCVCVCVYDMHINVFVYACVCVIIKFIFKVYFTFILRSIETLFNFFLNNLHLLRNSINDYISMRKSAMELFYMCIISSLSAN